MWLRVWSAKIVEESSVAFTLAPKAVVWVPYGFAVFPLMQGNVDAKEEKVQVEEAEQRPAHCVEFERGKPAGLRENLLERAVEVERRRGRRLSFMLTCWTPAGH